MQNPSEHLGGGEHFTANYSKVSDFVDPRAIFHRSNRSLASHTDVGLMDLEETYQAASGAEKAKLEARMARIAAVTPEKKPDITEEEEKQALQRISEELSRPEPMETLPTYDFDDALKQILNFANIVVHQPEPTRTVFSKMPNAIAQFKTAYELCTDPAEREILEEQIGKVLELVMALTKASEADYPNIVEKILIETNHPGTILEQSVNRTIELYDSAKTPEKIAIITKALGAMSELNKAYLQANNRISIEELKTQIRRVAELVNQILQTEDELKRYQLLDRIPLEVNTTQSPTTTKLNNSEETTSLSPEADPQYEVKIQFSDGRLTLVRILIGSKTHQEVDDNSTTTNYSLNGLVVQPIVITEAEAKLYGFDPTKIYVDWKGNLHHHGDIIGAKSKITIGIEPGSPSTGSFGDGTNLSGSTTKAKGSVVISGGKVHGTVMGVNHGVITYTHHDGNKKK